MKKLDRYWLREGIEQAPSWLPTPTNDVPPKLCRLCSASSDDVPLILVSSWRDQRYECVRGCILAIPSPASLPEKAAVQKTSFAGTLTGETEPEPSFAKSQECNG